MSVDQTSSSRHWQSWQGSHAWITNSNVFHLKVLNDPSMICHAQFAVFSCNWGSEDHLFDKWEVVKTIFFGDLIAFPYKAFTCAFILKWPGLTHSIPWNFTQFDHTLRMQIFCTYDELMGVFICKRRASVNENPGLLTRSWASPK